MVIEVGELGWKLLSTVPGYRSSAGRWTRSVEVVDELIRSRRESAGFQVALLVGRHHSMA